jgi:hypothetical protein
MLVIFKQVDVVTRHRTIGGKEKKVKRKADHSILLRWVSERKEIAIQK